VKGTIHWLSAKNAIPAEIRMYNRLFNDEDPGGNKEKDFVEFLNPESLIVNNNGFVEESLKDAKPLDHFQFERKGYFSADMDTTPEKPIFNLTVTLRDSWAKMAKK
jgi:glutaminyl-tRNA synthetase